MGYYEELDKEIDRDLGFDAAELDGSGKTEPARLRQALARMGHWGMDVGKGLWVVLGFPVLRSFEISWHGPTAPEKRAVWERVVDGIVTRLALVPVVVGVFFIMLVWLTTHPQVVVAWQTPAVYGLVYRHATLTSSDGQVLRGWYVPPVSVEDVLIEGEAVVRQRWPGVVVCHGLGRSQEQYLGLAERLHQRGFAVLLLDLRGQGESDGAAVTFGVRERLDVLAGVNYLREQPGIEESKIAVVGYGMAAGAGLQAAALDHGIGAVVADGVWPRFEDWLAEIFDQPGVPTGVMGKLYGLTFEMMLRERVGQLDLRPVVGGLSRQAVLFVVRETREQASINAVAALAAGMPGPHRVVTAEGTGLGEVGGEEAMCKFLGESLNWVPPRTRGSAEVQRLLEARVR